METGVGVTVGVAVGVGVTVGVGVGVAVGLGVTVGVGVGLGVGCGIGNPYFGAGGNPKKLSRTVAFAWCIAVASGKPTNLKCQGSNWYPVIFVSPFGYLRMKPYFQEFLANHLPPLVSAKQTRIAHP